MMMNVLKKYGVKLWTEFFGLVQSSWPVSCTDFQVQRRTYYKAYPLSPSKKGLISTESVVMQESTYMARKAVRVSILHIKTDHRLLE
jgi:hypothetical protein